MPAADAPPGPGAPPGGGAPSANAHAPTQAVDRAALGTAPTQAVAAVPSIATAPTQAVAAVPSIATAPTEAVAAVPSIATARTEAVALSSLPAPPSAPRAPAPAAPPSRMGALVAAAAILVILAVASTLFLLRHRAAAQHPGARPHTAIPGPPVSGAFSTLAKDQIRGRIEEGGHRVLGESAGEGVTTWVIETAIPGVTGSVKLHHYADAAQAEQAYAALHASGAAAARDGRAVLHVALPSPVAAAALLARIVR